MIDTRIIGLPIDVITLGTWWPGEFPKTISGVMSDADCLRIERYLAAKYWPLMA